MLGEARVKSYVKPRVFRQGARETTIKRGLGRGLVMNLDRQNSIQLEFGLQETELQDIYAHWITPGGIVADVGAANGDTSLLYAKLVGDSGHVYAFEPQTESVTALMDNIRLNPGLSTRLTVINAAVAAKAAEVPNLTLVSIDELVATGQMQSPTFVKIDVDGPEVDVLTGMTETMEKGHPVVLVETHSGPLERACQQYLTQRGYQTRLIDNAWWRRALYPELRPIAHNRWLLAYAGSS